MTRDELASKLAMGLYKHETGCQLSELELWEQEQRIGDMHFVIDLLEVRINTDNLTKYLSSNEDVSGIMHDGWGDYEKEHAEIIAKAISSSGCFSIQLKGEK